MPFEFTLLCSYTLVKVCGRRGLSCLTSVESVCCERANPFGQLIYLALLGTCYYAYVEYVFPLLADAGLPTWHVYTGTAAALATLGTFVLACYSDPGTITHSNVQLHQALYPYDDVIFSMKVCETCLLPKPARSKHCRISKRYA